MATATMLRRRLISAENIAQCSTRCPLWYACAELMARVISRASQSTHAEGDTDTDGRVLALEFARCWVVSLYVPNRCGRVVIAPSNRDAS